MKRLLITLPQLADRDNLLLATWKAARGRQQRPVVARFLATLDTRLGQLADSPELRESLGAAGREFVRERFPVERMVDELHALYLRLAASRGPSQGRSRATAAAVPPSR